MIAMKRNAGLIVSGALLLALVGCTAGEPPATAENHAQTVERDADTASVAAQPAVPSEKDGATPEAVEVTRAADGSSAELRKADPAATPSSPAPAQPAH
ncbi:hypothetical protein [Stenotrophomonas sp. ZAC14A_NAIMI4_1]|uniref:hypothetical protein n=1 Tax=Stenotrophomonas sp. ZAC14A_NAIMI4_1 TaxID=2072412 RepID=UPI001C1FD1C4|nr:hypothetical protein [Stenotrophomonas sp. ZAC14A_NAIMI4_1]